MAGKVLRSKKGILLLLLLSVFIGSCNTAKSDDALEQEVASFVKTLQMPTEDPWLAAIQPTLLPSDTASPSPILLLNNQTNSAPTETVFIPTDEPTAIPVPPTEVLSAPIDTSNSPTETPLPFYRPVIVDPNPSGADWKSLPIIPESITETAKDIYRYGVSKMGRRPNYFSKIGDCQSYPNVFMGEYDYVSGSYELSDDDLYLEDAINYFQESFGALSFAVANGLSAASLLTTIWSDPSYCESGESALLCELRINKPSIVFVNLGTNWVSTADVSLYEDYLDEIVYTIIQYGTLPILSSKADNVEGNNQINEITAAIAKKYGVPFFNFWAAAQSLENHGLDPARSDIYLSVDAWKVRSYWGLKMLYTVGHSLELF